MCASIEAICVDEIEKLAQHLNRTCSIGSDSSAAPSIIHGLGITASPRNDSATDPPPIAEDQNLLAQLTMLPEDVEAAFQDEASHAFPVKSDIDYTKTNVPIGTTSLGLVHRAGGSAGSVLRSCITGRVGFAD